ncbi:MAG TPA: helical backbone metal receptor [Kofleriaceae bacterium]|nr:helical backbone metal receptor [Kofleriaceae bacterium]
MKARPFLVMVLVGACAFAAVWLGASKMGRARETAAGARPRIVSLSPAITETLFALGVGDTVVGVTSRCDYPPEVAKIARVGAGTHPDMEAIARLEPTMILGEPTLRLSEEMLAPLAPTHLLPWLTASEIVRGVREIGALVDRRPEAEALAGRMERRWSVAPSANAPRVLMLLADQPGRVGPIYFVKPGSLHDTLLTAAGGRNAIEGTVRGVPTLSIEELLRLDPDAIVLLVANNELPPETRDRFVADFRSFPSLHAVRNDRVRVLHGDILFVTGPRVLAVIDRVADALRDMGLSGAADGRMELQGRP